MTEYFYQEGCHPKVWVKEEQGTVATDILDMLQRDVDDTSIDDEQREWQRQSLKQWQHIVDTIIEYIGGKTPLLANNLISVSSEHGSPLSNFLGWQEFDEGHKVNEFEMDGVYGSIYAHTEPFPVFSVAMGDAGSNYPQEWVVLKGTFNGGFILEQQTDPASVYVLAKQGYLAEFMAPLIVKYKRIPWMPDIQIVVEEHENGGMSITSKRVEGLPKIDWFERIAE